MKLQRARHRRANLLEEVAIALHLGLPLVEIDVRRFVDLVVRDVEPGEIEIACLRDPAEERLLAADAKACAIDDPLQDAHVLAEARPEELAVLTLAEPVHEEE